MTYASDVNNSKESNMEKYIYTGGIAENRDKLNIQTS